MLDGFAEVFDVVRRNKLRTTLTAASVAWGIFMLVLLLAAGTGLQNGVQHDFRDDAQNSIWIRQGRTSLPHEGHSPGRRIVFNDRDVEALQRGVDGLEHLTGRFYLWGGVAVSRGTRSGSFTLRGCHPDHQFLERTILTHGRFINQRDLDDKRKVAVIGIEVQRALFDKGEDPIGKVINIRGVNYHVVGQFLDEGSVGERQMIYVPISTAQLMYHGRDQVHQIMFTTGEASLEESKRMAKQTRSILAASHHFDPKDRRAVQVSNNLAQFQRLMDIFYWIRTFVWVVGLGTLFAGIVGVSNIMIISVQERTVELGVRRALGATPGSILSLIVGESILITSLAGYMGLVLGVGVVELVRRYIPDSEYLRQPSVDVSVGVGALCIIVIAGALSGLLPALSAARVKPIEAMRQV